jgi:nucleoside-diphosphate-sugar epimerase
MRGERLISDPVTRSTLPWLPLDGNIPAFPSNPYALSKCIGEDMLRYNVRHSEITAVSLRFPFLMAKSPTRTLPPKHCQRLDEAFTWLTYADGARLIRNVLVAPLRGFHIYFPAAPQPMVAGEVESLRQQFFPGVPLKVPAPLTSFVDLSAIQADTGWTPRDV